MSNKWHSTEKQGRQLQKNFGWPEGKAYQCAHQKDYDSFIPSGH